MSMECNCIKEVTAWVIMDALESMPIMDRIIIAAHYLDEYDVEYMATLLEMTVYGVEAKLDEVMRYIKNWCAEYELMHKMELAVVEEDVIHKAFAILLKQNKYIMNERVSMLLYDSLCKYRGV